MNTAAEYLDKTSSASRKLIDLINEYLQVLRGAPVPVFVTSTPPGPEFDKQFATWLEVNKEANAAAEAARQVFKAESFALDSVCGALLQIAEKAIEIYSTNAAVTPIVRGVVKAGTAKFSVGREVRGIPLGLIVYAARNQHTHFNDPQLREPSATVFELLATTPSNVNFAGMGPIRDPAFDLKNPALISFAANVTALLNWRSFEDYDRDMRQMLNA